MCGHIAATREARDTDTIEVDLRGSLGKLADRGNMVLKVRCSVRSAVGRGSERLLAVRRTPPIENQYRSEEHTSELQSLMRISYAVFCLKKKKTKHITNNIT